MNAPLPSNSTQNSAIVDALSNHDKAAMRRYQETAVKPDLSHIPGDSGMPIMGHTYWFLTGIHKWLNKQHVVDYGFVLPIQDLFLLLNVLHTIQDE